MAESDDSGNTLTEYVWLDDMPIALVANVATGPTLYFVHADHLDRPIRMTDSSENVVWDAVYNPFGGVNSITGSATNNLRFPGQYFLMEDGLHYNWYRHYDPTIGRYIQPDPLGHINGASLYAYVQSNPLQLIDPLGLWTGQVGFTVNLTVPGLGSFQYTAGVAFDGHGNVGTYYAAGGGNGVGEDASGGVSASWSNGDSICDLRGPFVNLSVTGGDGVSASADSFYGTSSDRAVVGGGATLGFGGGAGAAVTVTTTTVNPLFKLW